MAWAVSCPFPCVMGSTCAPGIILSPRGIRESVSQIAIWGELCMVPDVPCHRYWDAGGGECECPSAAHTGSAVSCHPAGKAPLVLLVRLNCFVAEPKCPKQRSISAPDKGCSSAGGTSEPNSVPGLQLGLWCPWYQSQSMAQSCVTARHVVHPAEAEMGQ